MPSSFTKEKSFLFENLFFDIFTDVTYLNPIKFSTFPKKEGCVLYICAKNKCAHSS